MEPFLGQIMAVGFNFAPRGWALCEGQLLPISQNTALFSLLGTTYGGDGRTTFALPDLRGRVIAGVGDGSGLYPIRWGQKTGSNTNTLTVNELPSHSHKLEANTTAGSRTLGSDPTNKVLAKTDTGQPIYTSDAPTTIMGQQSISSTGGSQPVNNMQPTLGINYIIALQGIFPSRS